MIHSLHNRLTSYLHAQRHMNLFKPDSALVASSGNGREERKSGPTGRGIAYNKIYLLRSLRCSSSSGARPYAPKMPSSHKRDACFVLLRQALRAHLVTQFGFTA